MPFDIVKGVYESIEVSALTQLRAMVADNYVIVVPVVTTLGADILIVNKAHDPHNAIVVRLPELTTERLERVVRGPEDNPTSAGWLNAYKINYLPPDQQTARWPAWLAAIQAIGPELWQLFAGGLDTALKDNSIPRGSRLIWLPTGALGILPLGVAQNPLTLRSLADDYEIIYAPSVEALTAARARIARGVLPTLLAVINPTGDLIGTEREGAVVASYFPHQSTTILEREKATVDSVIEALKGKAYWHFSSHGSFSWEDARDSALLMHSHAPLSVGKLLETEGLGHPRLVVLSACETGLYDISHNSDEFVGLPGAFMALGAAGVLGTLWPVADDATALLMAKFYELHIGKRLPPAAALRGAQAWLRAATGEDVRRYTKVVIGKGIVSRRREKAGRTPSGVSVASPNERLAGRTKDESPKVGRSPDSTKDLPYGHPYYWAGFIYTGL